MMILGLPVLTVNPKGQIGAIFSNLVGFAGDFIVQTGAKNCDLVYDFSKEKAAIYLWIMYLNLLI